MTSVSGFRIEQDAPCVYLVFIQRHSGNSSKIRNPNKCSAFPCPFRKIIAHFPRMSSGTRSSKLYFRQQAVAVFGVRNRQIKKHSQFLFLRSCAIDGNSKRWKRLKRHWFGYVFIPQSSKAVISTYKQIVPRDMRTVVKWRFVRLSFDGETVPQILHLVRHRPPGSQRPAMDCKTGLLSLCRRERRTGAFPYMAFPVQMIRSDISGGAVEVTEQYVWSKLVHRLLQVLG